MGVRLSLSGIGTGKTFEFKEADYSMETGFVLPARDFLPMMSIEEVSDGTDPETSYPAVWPLGGGA